MLPYEEYQRMFPEPSVVRPKHIYFAYKNGEVEEFGTRAEAKAYSNLVEEVITNQEDVAAYKKARSACHKKVCDTWKDALREEFNFLVERGVFDDALSFVQCELDTHLDNYANHLGDIEAIVKKAFTLFGQPKPN